jgi:hypothetical protein
MNPLQTKWELMRIEHCFYAEIVAAITTRDYNKLKERGKAQKG